MHIGCENKIEMQFNRMQFSRGYASVTEYTLYVATHAIFSATCPFLSSFSVFSRFSLITANKSRKSDAH